MKTAIWFRGAHWRPNIIAGAWRTRAKTRSSAILLLVLAFTSVSCGNRSVNVARTAGLADTVAIEIDENDIPGVSTPRHVAVTDSASIRSIIGALDTSIPLVPRTRCPDIFTIRFRLGDGRVVEFGYSCDPQPSFLRGGQQFWGGKEVRPPVQFDRLVQEKIRSLADH